MVEALIRGQLIAFSRQISEYLNFIQDEYKDPDDEAEEEKKAKAKSRGKKGMKGEKELTPVRKILTVEEGHDTPLTGIGIYLLRTSTKRTLG